MNLKYKTHIIEVWVQLKTKSRSISYLIKECKIGLMQKHLKKTICHSYGKKSSSKFPEDPEE